MSGTFDPVASLGRLFGMTGGGSAQPANGGFVGSLGPNSINDAGALGVPQFAGLSLGSNPQLAAPAGALSAGSGLDSGLGWNIGTGQLAVGGLNTLSNLYTAYQAQGLAKKQFELTKGISNINLNNQIRSYNTTLEDRANSRGVVEGRSAAETADYIARARMTR